MAGHTQLDVQKLAGTRLHTRVIIRDRKQAFLGSQSLRAAELDSRRELGLIIHDAKTVKSTDRDLRGRLDQQETKKEDGADRRTRTQAADKPAVSEKEAEKAVQVLTKELDPLAVSVKKAVMTAVANSGEDILHDKDVKHTMKQVVKKAAKEAVKEAVQEAQERRRPSDGQRRQEPTLRCSRSGHHALRERFELAT